MLFIHIPTLFLASALCSALVAIGLALGARAGTRPPGLREMVWAELSLTAGLVLLGLRDYLSPWFGIVVGNAFVSASAVLLWLAIRALFDAGARWRTGLVLLGLSIGVDGVMFAVSGDSVARAAVSSLMVAALYALPGIMLLAHRRSAFDGRAHYLVAAAVFGGSAALLARVIWGVVGTPSVEEFALLSPSPINVAVAVSIFVVVIIGSLGFLMVVRERDLRMLALIDGLTGVYNRRAALDQMRSVVGLSERRGLPSTLVLADLDHFKKINDSCGHAAGDEVLRRFAEMTRKLLRQGDLFGRYGGEEFVLLLPGATAAEAMGFAERWRRKAMSAPVRWNGIDIPYTFSIGVVEIPAGERAPLETMLERADQALYTAKAEGRNRAVIHPRPDAAVI